MENAIRELTVAIENLGKHQYDIIDYIAIILSLYNGSVVKTKI